MKERILIVEDDTGLARVIRDGLIIEGFNVDVMHSAEGALKLIRSARPDLAIVDVGLPGFSGFQLLELLRNHADTAYLPVIFLTALHTEKDKVHGLAVGADDYVTKPFSEKELIARVHAVLRRAQGKRTPTSMLSLGDLRLDIDAREVLCAGQPVALSKLEFDLLAYMLQRPGAVHTYDALMNNVWGRDRIVSPHTVTVTISRLREKLGTAGQSIVTIKDVGYKVVASASP